MKKYTLYIVCFLLAVLVISCKKENNDNVLRAKMSDFNTQKAYIDNQRFSCFRSGEGIRVNNQTYTVNGSNLMDDNRTCKIVGITESDYYHAFYPDNLLVSSNVNLTDGVNGIPVHLPGVQEFQYESDGQGGIHQVINNPMAGSLTASNGGGTIQFHNLCALLKVTVYSTTNSTLKWIDVRLKGATIWGTGTINAEHWRIDMDNNQLETGDHSTVRLSFGQNGRQGNPNGETFYIVVPKATVDATPVSATSANDTSVHVVIHGDYIDNNISVTDRIFNMTLSSQGEIEVNTIKSLHEFSIGCHPTYYNNHTNCVFTVNSSGKKVTISQRNLIHHKTQDNWSCMGTPYHGIPIETYDYFISYNTDLLGNNAQYDLGWTNAVDGYPERTWRIPTRSEWIFILTGRSGSRFAKAVVDYHRGLIIFPDGWTYNSNSNRHKKLSKVNDISANYKYDNNNNISTSEWTTFENEGCVFLAAHGYLNSPNQSGQDKGYYAMADSYLSTINNYSCLLFNNGGLSCDETIANKGGVNIRLVHDLNFK